MLTIAEQSLPDAEAIAAASRNESHTDQRSGAALWLVLAFVAALMLGAYSVAGVRGAAVVASMLGVLVFADEFSVWADEERRTR